VSLTRNPFPGPRHCTSGERRFDRQRSPRRELFRGRILEMPEFVSIRSYLIFEDHVKNRSRYVLDTVQQQFLDTVLQTIEPACVLPLQSGRILHRAQRGFLGDSPRVRKLRRVRLFDDEGDDGGTEDIEVLVKLPKAVEKMVPTPEHAADGRVNVRGIPCRFLSTTASAAISEMRRWVGSYVTLAQFKLARDLRLVNCSLDTPASPPWFAQVAVPGLSAKSRLRIRKPDDQFVCIYRRESYARVSRKSKSAANLCVPLPRPPADVSVGHRQNSLPDGPHSPANRQKLLG
jgi:hypothetical protein